MKNYTIVLLGLIAVESPAVAQNGVFKCTGTAGAIAYQGTPCRDRQSQVTLVEPRKVESLPADAAPDVKPAQDASAGEKRLLPVADELNLGMSDTKVLNMRGWGKPQHIARSRGQQGWWEEWTYVSRADGATRTVQFLNGKVASLKSQDAQQVARATVRPAEPLVQASAPPSIPSIEQTARAGAGSIEQPVVREAPQSAIARIERTPARSDSPQFESPAPLVAADADTPTETAQSEFEQPAAAPLDPPAMRVVPTEPSNRPADPIEADTKAIMQSGIDRRLLEPDTSVSQ